MSMLNIGTSALLTTQGALSTTSHNISNANTEGYSRQRTTQGTNIPHYTGGYYFGSGVQITGVQRIFDEFLSDEVSNYTSQASQQETFLTFAKQVDDLLGSKELGINTGLEEFFNAVHEVANDPTAISARQVMLTQGQLLADRFNTLDVQMQSFDKQIDGQISVVVEDINTITRGIAELNQAINAMHSTVDNPPNDLLDQRDQLINKLSEYVSVSTVRDDTGAMNVFIGTGQVLVSGSSAISLSVISTTTSPVRNSVGYGPASTDISAQLTGGSLGGALQVRSEIIDSTRAQLSDLAFSIVDVFNTQHQAGIDLNGAAGGFFFGDLSAIPATDYAGAMKVVMTDPREIAASSVANAGVGNNENAAILADLQITKTLVGGTQTFADGYNALVANVATRTHQADLGLKSQQGLLNQVKLRFDSVSGVNLDEEAANLIKFQQAYQAASQIITVSNTVFNALMNAV